MKIKSASATDFKLGFVNTRNDATLDLAYFSPTCRTNAAVCFKYVKSVSNCPNTKKRTNLG